LIDNNNDLKINYNCKIFNILGELVYSFYANQERSIDISGWQAGIYYLTINSGKEIKEIKFIKN
jgi:hypothetical protein